MIAYAIEYEPGELWTPGKPMYMQPIHDHARYQESLYQRGIMLASGPYKSRDGGLLVLQAESLEQARQILLEDPAIQKKIMRGSVTEWQIVRGRFLGE
mgnify:CR=1 FL=1